METNGRDGKMRFAVHIFCLLILTVPAAGLDSEVSEKALPLTPKEGAIEVFGRTFVYKHPPTFETGVVLQKGNDKPKEKIQLKKSGQIKDTPFGAMPAQVPRLPRHDYTAHWLEYYGAPWEGWTHPGDFLAKNLIDGDLTTEWCSREQAQPDVESQWIRIDLPREREISGIRILPSHLMRLEQFKGFGLPSALTVKLSRDAWHWTTVYSSELLPSNHAQEPVIVRLDQPVRVKQVWIIGDHLRSCNLPFGSNHHYFMCGEVEVLDDQGDNLALASRGAGVQVSSTFYGAGDNWEIYEYLWPTIWDQGFSWARVSGWGGTLLWSAVEREKGKYAIDPRSDEAITELVENGVKPLMILCYNNPIYDDGGWFNFALTGEARDAFVAYCRFMARHFKGRVSCYEIWNEPGLGSDEHLAIYCRLLRDAAQAIRAEDPRALISFCGLAFQFFPEEIKKQNYGFGIFDKLMENRFVIDGIDIAELVDVFGWHAQGEARYGQSDAVEKFALYRKEVKNFHDQAHANGFGGTLKASEFWLGAPYPPYGDEKLEFAGQQTRLTEIRKAKDTVRLFMAQAGMGVKSFWCNNWFTQVQWDDGFFRSGFAADPVAPVQPNALYYVLRNLCTLMSQTQPCETLRIQCSNKEGPFQIFNFSLPDDRYYVGLWLMDKSGDTHPGVATDILVEDLVAESVAGIDTFNGFAQELEFENTSNGLVIQEILVRDYPLLLSIRAGP